MRKWLSLTWVALCLSLGASGDSGRDGLPSPGTEKSVLVPPRSADRIEWTYTWQINPATTAEDAAGAGGVSTTCEAVPKEPDGNPEIETTNLRVFSSRAPEETDMPWFLRLLSKPDSD